MKLFFTLSLLLIVCALKPIYAQTCPPNLDFETGTFVNWQCSVGSTSTTSGGNQITLAPSAPIPGRHEIISQTSPTAMDPFGKFPQLCPYGGGYSVKLGNSDINAEAEGISYTFTIPSTNDDTFSFTYYYAVVFEDPSHALPEQPRFFVTAYDIVTGDVINCASYNYISNGAIPGFQVSPGNSTVLYKNWSPASIQFAGLAGRTVRLEFKTADCTLGGHFGYAYLDVGTGCSNILATAPYCQETNSIILNAPYGFQTYTWYNEDYTAVVGNQQSITLSPPPATSGTFHVDIIPYPGYGCRDTVNAVITPLPVPDTPVAISQITLCQFQNTVALSATPSPNCDLLWYTAATGGTGNNLPPIPSTSTSGTFNFYVSQKVLFGCESLRKKITVTVLPTPQASFTINQARQCLNGNQYVFTSNSTNLQNAEYNWTFGDGETRTTTVSSINYTYKTAGNFSVTLKVTNANLCFTSKTLPVSVIPKPIADFSFPSLVCQYDPAVNISNGSSVPNGSSTINQWWWNINSSIHITQTAPAFSTNAGGDYTIKLVATTTEGCRSDTASKKLTIRYVPVSDFTYSSPLCENEFVRFTDASTLPASATAENISIWNWQIDNSTFTDRHPKSLLSAGQHKATLVTESNFGCKSTPVSKNFFVNIKPVVSVTITDSCVRRNIVYTASNSTGPTVKWLWNFGNGLQDRPNIQYRNYGIEGNHTLTLIGQNNFGCKDTLIRPYTIFENHAYAGRDTVVAMDEPVQLNANGDDGCQYIWSPAIGLNNTAIENPIALLKNDQRYQLDALTKEGCDKRSNINIKRFKGPELYIPSTFTPNNDGLNDILKVFPVGIRSFEFFAVYNRLGQQIFYTKDYNRGWNGTFKGMPQDPGAYVVVARAVDYRGKVMLQKLSVLLLR